MGCSRRIEMVYQGRRPGGGVARIVQDWRDEEFMRRDACTGGGRARCSRRGTLSDTLVQPYSVKRDEISINDDVSKAPNPIKVRAPGAED